MPRIDPKQLLNCLSVLLSEDGGIKSQAEVHRLASLMDKFSKKLVSKCIYILILKRTETELLKSFMNYGGWNLTHMWLTDSIIAKNVPLIQELLELLLLCPVDVDRLKTNNCPKLVKELSKDGSKPAIRLLAGKLVEQWLKIVKGEPSSTITMVEITETLKQINNDSVVNSYSDKDLLNEESAANVDIVVGLESSNELSDTISEIITSDIAVTSDKKINHVKDILFDSAKINKSDVGESNSVVANEDFQKEEALPILKISMKDGKQIISKVEDSLENKKGADSGKSSKDKEHKSKSKDKNKEKEKEEKHSSKSSSHKQSSNHLLHSSKSSKHSSSSKDKDKTTKLEKHSHTSRSSSSHDKDKRDKDKKSDKKKDSSNKDDSKSSVKVHKDEKSSKNEKSKTEKSSKDDRSTKSKDSADKNKETLDKLHNSIKKLGKIPKKSDAPSVAKKDIPSISIEVRKPNDPNRPKTVKMFNSKFRSHGLEEEAKPPLPRGAVVKKPPPALPPTVSIPKRPSPLHSSFAPPEKKPKTVEPVEKPGAIKLIAAKPKLFLMETDLFMEAISAAASKKEPKKRKRRTSGSKDGNPQDQTSPPNTPPVAASPVEKTDASKPVAMRFYQDTLETEEEKDKEPSKENATDKILNKIDKDSVEMDSPLKPMKDEEEEPEKKPKTEEEQPKKNGLKGVLCYHKKKGPKKSIRWRPDSELEEVQYFELYENERVNVTKTFVDLKHMERVHEREIFQKARNISSEDIMEEKISWRPLIPIDFDVTVVEYGKHSREKDIQATRQKGILQSLYFHKSMIPDSAAEPDSELHTVSDPVIIPLDDVTNNPDSVNDFRNTLWPEPKQGHPGAMHNGPPGPQMFQPMPPFAQNFHPNPQFPMGGFQGQGQDWPPNIPPGVMPNVGMGSGGMPPVPLMQAGAMPPGSMPPGAMPPGAMPPGAMPPGAMPPGAMPHGGMPPGVMPGMMMHEGMMMPPDMYPGGPGPMYAGMAPGPVPGPDGFVMMDNMNGPGAFGPGFPGVMQGGPMGPGAQVPNGPQGQNGPPGNFGFNGRGNMRGSGPRGNSGPNWRNKGPGKWDGPARGGRGGGRGRTLCTYFQKKGFCRQGENCAFLHPGVNGPY